MDKNMNIQKGGSISIDSRSRLRRKDCAQHNCKFDLDRMDRCSATPLHFCNGPCKITRFASGHTFSRKCVPVSSISLDAKDIITNEKQLLKMLGDELKYVNNNKAQVKGALLNYYSEENGTNYNLNKEIKRWCHCKKEENFKEPEPYDDNNPESNPYGKKKNTNFNLETELNNPNPRCVLGFRSDKDNTLRKITRSRIEIWRPQIVNKKYRRFLEKVLERKATNQVCSVVDELDFTNTNWSKSSPLQNNNITYYTQNQMNQFPQNQMNQFPQNQFPQNQMNQFSQNQFPQNQMNQMNQMDKPFLYEPPLLQPILNQMLLPLDLLDQIQKDLYTFYHFNIPLIAISNNNNNMDLNLFRWVKKYFDIDIKPYLAKYTQNNNEITYRDNNFQGELKYFIIPGQNTEMGGYNKTVHVTKLNGDREYIYKEGKSHDKNPLYQSFYENLKHVILYIIISRYIRKLRIIPRPYYIGLGSKDDTICMIMDSAGTDTLNVYCNKLQESQGNLSSKTIITEINRIFFIIYKELVLINSSIMKDAQSILFKHNDLHSKNIMMMKEPNGMYYPVLIDFGFVEFYIGNLNFIGNHIIMDSIINEPHVPSSGYMTVNTQLSPSSGYMTVNTMSSPSSGYMAVNPMLPQNPPSAGSIKVVQSGYMTVKGSSSQASPSQSNPSRRISPSAGSIKVGQSSNIAVKGSSYQSNPPRQSIPPPPRQSNPSRPISSPSTPPPENNGYMELARTMPQGYIQILNNEPAVGSSRDNRSSSLLSSSVSSSPKPKDGGYILYNTPPQQLSNKLIGGTIGYAKLQNTPQQNRPPSQRDERYNILDRSVPTNLPNSNLPNRSLPPHSIKRGYNEAHDMLSLIASFYNPQTLEESSNISNFIYDNLFKLYDDEQCKSNIEMENHILNNMIFKLYINQIITIADEIRETLRNTKKANIALIYPLYQVFFREESSIDNILSKINKPSLRNIICEPSIALKVLPKCLQLNNYKNIPYYTYKYMKLKIKYLNLQKKFETLYLK